MRTQAEEFLQQGRIDDALASVQAQVRNEPADVKHRIFLFQLLAIMGRWEKAITQLNVAADLDADALLMAQVCRPALNCEALRVEVFAGRTLPVMLGEPRPWAALMVQANQLSAQGRHPQAAEIRAKALDDAPALSGTADGAPFEWIADADSRLGPLLEAIVDGRYFWIPFDNIAVLEIDKPTDLRDMVWTPTRFTWRNGGTAAGFIPTRYPGSDASTDSSIRTARKTEWVERDAGTFEGLGQRLLATDSAEYPLLDVRRITIGETPPAASTDPASAANPAQ